MKDFLGEELQVGDEVVYISSSDHRMVKGVIDQMSSLLVWLKPKKNGKSIRRVSTSVVKVPRYYT